MKKINDGGTAFPIGSTPEEWGNGMTLRDYFAAKAMAQMIDSQLPPELPHEMVDGFFEIVAGYSYLMADAMLAAREVQS